MAGRVVRVSGRDTVVVAGARVILHRVTTTQPPGPVDSTLSDARGHFVFRLSPDSGAVYLVSARWASIEYFAPPLGLRAEAPDTAMLLIVADTSSSAPVRLAARHLIVSPLAADGVRNVVDLFLLDNPGPMTRVSSDSLVATWQVRLPRFAVNIHGGNSGFSLETMRLHGDTVGLYAPIPPGQRDIEIDYQIPPNTRQFQFPNDYDAPMSNIVSEDKQIAVDGPFIRADTVIDTKKYARWQGHLVAGQPLVIVLQGNGVPAWLIPVMVLVMGTVLVGVTVRSGSRAGS